MNTKLLIIGAGGHGRVIADIALKMKKWEYIAFLDDSENVKTSMGIEIIDKSTSISKYIEDYDIFVGIGNNVVRKKVQEELEDLGAIIPALIHPSAIIGEQVYLGAGTVVMAGAVINCCTKIGKGSIINTASTIDHDNKIDDYVHISPGAHLAGTVRVGSGTWLGIGSVVINNINITNDCKIGAGAVVIRDIAEVGTYVGVPAKRMDE
ncbi:acetyltransferase [Bacillus cereus]|mgnify:CR=1 FL=1|uniref:Acetyltransferase n=1 Tax=Bacillus cereus TaxID=1396 RepID=A0ABD7DBT1_BACCE|nr:MULTISPECIES: acetyltransferase [Bacillus cereus group]EOO06073.1 sialic acid O-acetyltransferase NeuD family sugar O-acyltransferase [Bacillus cereus str. Schrouff]EOO91344.1 sialic acid O-acetyltransferase NeuD family sugar O-acyltransferase [Bacillus cereus K-5975c]KAB5631373.1 acetyltransferase [Bacillus thuringiensis]MCU4883415.1 acetyltransferase [Bacillus cereus]MDY0951249.1 acetyltransferase [Bacillus thuringiensis]